MGEKGGKKGKKEGEGRRRTIIGVLAKCCSIACILFVNWIKISSRATRCPSSTDCGLGAGGDGRWLCGINVAVVSSLRWGSIGD